MANNANSQSQLLFVQLESTFGTIPNSSNLATVANANACRIMSAGFTGNTQMIDRPDKTINLTETVGVRGRSMGLGRGITMSLAGSGAAGTAPDMGPFLQALFGKAPTIVAATSVTYNLDDLSPSLSVWNFRDPSTMEQQVALGTIITGAKFSFGSDAATAEFQTESLWPLSSAAFSTSDTTQKGGLSAFPARPSAPVTNGNFAVGFTGAISLDGNAYSLIRNGAINMSMNRSLRKNLYNSYYPGAPQQLRRQISFDLEMDDDDSSNLNTLKAKAVSKTSVAVSIQIGTVAGNIWTFTFPTIQLADYSFTDGEPTWGLSLQGNKAKGTGKDEVVLALT